MDTWIRYLLRTTSDKTVSCQIMLFNDLDTSDKFLIQVAQTAGVVQHAKFKKVAFSFDHLEFSKKIFG